MSTPQQARSIRTRQKLVDATIQTLIDRGYTATSMPETCKRAGVSRGAQLHHFPKKAELLAAAIETLIQQRHDELAQAVRASRPADLVDTFVNELWTIYSGRTFYAWLELAVAARTDPELQRHLQGVNDRLYDQAAETLQGLFPKRVSPERLKVMARFVTSFMDGVAVNRMMDDDDEMSRDTLELFRVVIRRALETMSQEGTR